MRLVLLGLLAVLAMLPATASAAVHVSYSSPETLLVVDDGPSGNDVSLSVQEGIVTVVAYPTVTADASCQTNGFTHAECPAAGLTSVRVELGDGDDELESSLFGPLPRVVHGGEGNDTLAGAPGDDVLDGGPGDDRVIASAGDDEMIGGEGTDWLDYADNPFAPGVVVALPETGTSTGNGAVGEDDVLHDDFEALNGGWGDDTLTGTARPETISGGDGDDSIDAGDGDDRLFGDEDFDTFDAGPGDDWINAAEPWVSDPFDGTIDCGPGDDAADADNKLDGVRSGCETVAPEVASAHLVGLPRVGGAMELRLSISGGPVEDTQLDWRSCTTSICWPVSPVGMSYTLVEEDRDRTLGVEIKVSNSAGEGWGSTAAGPIGSRVQSPPPAPADDPPPPGDAPAPPQAPVAVASPLDLLRSSLRARLTKLARRMATSDPRAIARRGLARHRLVMPATGFLALRWVARGRTIGAGRADGTDGEPAVVDVKLSRRGRALLRRSKRIAVVVRGSFVGGAATKASPATAEASFTLRRRRA